MSNSHNQQQYTRPTLNAWHTQLIHAQQRIIMLEETAQQVREDLEMRADIGTYAGDSSIQLSNSVWHKLCDVTDKYGSYREALEEIEPTRKQRVHRYIGRLLGVS